MNGIAVIFDMDGVIIDSEKVYQAIEREMYRELGISISPEEHAQYMGTSERSMWKHMKEVHGFTADPESLVALERDRFLEALNSSGGIPPMEGIYPLLDGLKDKGIPKFIASSSSRNIIESVVGRLGIESCFNGIVSGDDVSNSKPAPDIFLKASDLAGVKPAYCVVIEDSPNGVRAARAAGMRVIGLADCAEAAASLAGADRVIENLGEFMEILYLLDFQGN
jgi:HAD superfamily hydrolase (TIGR01509 family)